MNIQHMEVSVLSWGTPSYHFMFGSSNFNHPKLPWIPIDLHKNLGPDPCSLAHPFLRPSPLLLRAPWEL